MKVIDFFSEPIGDSINDTRTFTHKVMRTIRTVWVPAVSTKYGQIATLKCDVVILVGMQGLIAFAWVWQLALPFAFAHEPVFLNSIQIFVLAYAALPVDDDIGTPDAGLRNSERAMTRDDDFYAERERAIVGFELEDEE